MELDEVRESITMQPQVSHTGEVCMVDQARWAEIRRLFDDERVSISEIGRRLALDRKPVAQSATAHVAPVSAGGRDGDPADGPCRRVRAQAPQVNYSADGPAAATAQAPIEATALRDYAPRHVAQTSRPAQDRSLGRHAPTAIWRLIWSHILAHRGGGVPAYARRRGHSYGLDRVAGSHG
jgi:hypothetical protein